MELRHLRYFVAVAHELHFRRAAERLHIAQPALSQQIKKLEHELGVMLLTRTKRRVALTEAGAVFLVEARRILDLSREAVATARRAAAGEIGRLRVGYVDWTVYLPLPQIVRRYRRLHPEVSLTIAEMHTVPQREALEHGDLDVGLFGLSGEAGIYETEVVAEDPVVVGLPESHPLAALERVPLAALAEEPWVLLQRDLQTAFVELVLRTCAAAGFVPRVVQEADHLNTVAALVSAGLGVTLLPRTVARLSREHFVWRALTGRPPIHPLYAVWRKGGLTPTAARFLAIVREVRDGHVFLGI